MRFCLPVVRTLAVTLLSLGGMTWGGGAWAAAPEPLALGLIVKLKASAREAQAADAKAQAARVSRLSRVAAAAGYPVSMPWRAHGAGIEHMRVPTPLKSAQVARIVQHMLATGEVEWVEPNVREARLQAAPVPNPALALPNDPYVGTAQQWAVFNVDTASDPRRTGLPNLDSAWRVHRGATSGQTVIAVLDTGYLRHPDLATNLIEPGYSFVSDASFDRAIPPGRQPNAHDPGDWLTQAEKDANPTLYQGCDVQPSSWHGTMVAGILGAVTNNALGIAGVHQNARVLPVRVAGVCGAELIDILDGLRWAAGLPVTVNNVAVTNATPAKVLNLSFGADTPCGSAYQTVIDEIRQTKGALLIASAGNAQGGVSRPGNCNGVLAVAALNRTGLKANYSNFGPEVAVSTVGGDPGPEGAWGGLLGDGGLLTLYNTGTTIPLNEATENSTAGSWYAYVGGTSFSAPMAAGVAALMWELNPALTPDQIINGIKLSARPHVTSSYAGTCSSQNPGRCLCTTSTCGAGILDAARALKYAQNPAGTLPTVTADNIDSLALTTAVQLGPDAPPRPVTTSSTATRTSGGGGGGAMDDVALCGLLGALVWTWARRSRGGVVQR